MSKEIRKPQVGDVYIHQDNGSLWEVLEVIILGDLYDCLCVAKKEGGPFSKGETTIWYLPDKTSFKFLGNEYQKETDSEETKTKKDDEPEDPYSSLNAYIDHKMSDEDIHLERLKREFYVFLQMHSGKPEI